MKRPTSVVGRHVSVYGNVCNANSPATKGNCEERVSKKPYWLLSANCWLTRWPTFRYISLVCWHVVGNNNNYHCITIIIVQPSADLDATLEIWPVLFTGQWNFSKLKLKKNKYKQTNTYPILVFVCSVAFFSYYFYLFIFYPLFFLTNNFALLKL